MEAALDPRAALDALIRARGEDYAGLSRLLGRNPAYVQQFIKRGSPRRLTEEDRATLARYFDVAEAVLGGRPEPVLRVAETERGVPRRTADVILVPRLTVAAAAGAGAETLVEAETGRRAFDAGWLRSIGAEGTAGLSLIAVQGDSMLPTLLPGDELLVDRADAPLRDGVFVLRGDDGLLVKRLTREPGGRAVTISSDNPAFPRWTGIAPRDVVIVGRALWAGRALG